MRPGANSEEEDGDRLRLSVNAYTLDWEIKEAVGVLARLVQEYMKA